MSVKTRMTALDVRATVAEMSSQLEGLRLVQIYDNGAKLFFFKFGHGDTKKFVLVEPGVRMHITLLNREKPKMPSQFTFKLRKYIRSWRLNSVMQLGGDRAIALRLGSDQASFYLVVELYARGNIILVSHEHMMLVLLRSHRDTDVTYAVNERFPIGLHDNEKADDGARGRRIADAVTGALRTAPAGQSLRNALAVIDHFGPHLAEHIVLAAGLKPSDKAAGLQDEAVAALAAAAMDAIQLLIGPLPPGGYLVRKVGKNTATDSGELLPERPETATFEDFAPVKLRQFDVNRLEQRESFGDVCDSFFLATEMEKIESHNEKKELTALSARERFLRDHKRRIGKLESEEEENMRKGAMIEANASSVQAVIDLMNMLLAMKLGWEKIKVLVRARQSEGHPVAYMIHDIHFERSAVTVLLEEELQEGEEDNEVEPLAVDIDLTMNAQRNASRYYSMKKQVHAKLEKTIAATDKAAAGAERKGQKAAAKHGAPKKEITAQRRIMWYEKFLWVISSAGDLVVAGRDNQQTDQLTRKYMSSGDVFVHSDANKALPCVVKPLGGRLCVPLASIQEAGAMCVSRSAAWDSKASVSAWWVPAASVLKDSAGSGVHMNPAMFAVSTERKYLMPMPLSLSVAVLFRVKSQQATVPLAESDETIRLPTPVDDSETQCMSRQAPLLNSERHIQRQISAETVQSGVHESKQHQLPKKKVLSAKSLGQKTPSITPVDTASEETKSASQRSSHPSAQASLNRRMKNKMKKIQKRYSEQDDEDRAQCMLALGNRPSRVHGLLAKKTSADSSDDDGHSSVSDSPPVEVEERKEKKEVKFADVSCPETEVPTAEQKRQKSDAQVVEALADGAQEISFLTGTLSDQDDVLYAVCVCAPSSSVVKHTLRVEITHGTEKKGAAASSILQFFNRSADALAQTARTAIAHLDAEALQNQLVGNVKVHFPQAAKPRVARHHVDAEASR